MTGNDPLAITIVGELPPGPWRLANSPWPRTAGDRRNSRRTNVEGPSRGRIRRVSEQQGEGLAVAADQSLRMTGHGCAYGFDPSGKLLWDLELHGRASEARASAPLLLADGTCIVTISRSLVFVSARGQALARVTTKLTLDDSGPAPNLSAAGSLILTTPLGQLLELRGSTLSSLGIGLGYDLVPPAIDDEGRMALCGYGGKGLIFTDPRGAILWSSGLKYADLLPTIDHEGRVAGGSVNEHESRIFDRDGKPLATYPAAAAFAVTDQGWIALAEHSLAKLGPRGELRWQRKGGARRRWGSLGPAVDRKGRIYAPCGPQLVALEPDGSERYVVELPSEPLDLALVGTGKIAIALAEGLYFVE
jgi:outer membrane protein assembly factor BamB